MTVCRLLAFGLFSITIIAPPCLPAEKRSIASRDDQSSVSNRSYSSPSIKVDVALVLVPVHVTTMLGKPITDLESKSFRLFDDNVELSIQSFAKDDAPVSVGVLFDCSRSMQSKIRQSADASAAFLNTANKEDEHFLIEFGDRPRLSIPFTGDAAQLTARITQIRPSGRTSLFDAIHMGLSQMKFARNKRKSIVIFSDGGDNWSRKTLNEIRRQLAEMDVQLYAVEIVDEQPNHKPSREELAAPGILKELTEITGGTHLRSNLTNLKTMSEFIGKDLRSQYVLGYAPVMEVRDGKYHRVKVTLIPGEKMPDLRVSHRPGYYAAWN